MSREPHAGVIVEEPSSPASRLIAWGVVAVLGYAALLDAAVETFISGSPLRWWIAPGVLVVVALGVWLWRPGGALLRRMGPATGAATPFLGLLALLAITAWLPEGQTEGVRMLLQSTSRLLTGTIALAVVLATFVVFRAAESLPGTPRLIARAVFTALAIYALIALGLGIRDNTPFADLFHGSALWQRLPRWLQGTFIGGFVLLPLAALAALTRAVGRRWRQPIRRVLQQAIALTIAFVMALSGVLVPASAQQAAGAAPRELAERADAARERLTGYLLRSDTGADLSAAQVGERLDKILDAVGLIAAGIPRDTFDVAAVVSATGKDRTKIFEWVRDHTYFVPYRGTLRGPTGVLMDRLGNSLDRALLLAALLKAAGFKSRLARAMLSPSQVDSVLAGVRPIPGEELRGEPEGERDRMKAVTIKVAEHLGVDPSQLARLDQTTREASQASIARNVKIAETQASTLLTLVTRPDNGDDGGADAAASDHWWAQVQQADGWQDLDPSLPSARPGESLDRPADTFEAEQIPDNLHHDITVRVVIERVLGNHLDAQVVLSHRIRPSNLIGQPVTIQNVPFRWKPAADWGKTSAWQDVVHDVSRQTDWMPLLSIGTALFADKAFTTEGKVTDARGALSGATAVTGGIFGALGGGEVQEQPRGLTAQWIEYESHVPGERIRTVRRPVFDMIGPAARAAGGARALAVSSETALRRALQLQTETTVLPLACRLSPDYVAWLAARALEENRRALAGIDGELTNEDAPLGIVAAPTALYAFSLLRQSWNPTGGDGILVRPNLVSQHRGLRAGAPGALSAFQTLDVVENSVGVRRGAANSPFETRLRQGVFDTNAEAVVQSACCGTQATGAAAAYSPEARPATEWQVLRTDAAAGGVVGVPPDMLQGIRNDLKGGNIVVAAPLAVNERGGWWRIDPATGDTLGMTPAGFGGSQTEKGTLEAQNAAKIKAARLQSKMVSYLVCSALSAATIAESRTTGGFVFNSAKGLACVLGGQLGISGFRHDILGWSLWGDRLSAISSLLSAGQILAARATRKDVDATTK